MGYNDSTGSFVMNLSKHSLIYYKWVEQIKTYILLKKINLIDGIRHFLQLREIAHVRK